MPSVCSRVRNNIYKDVHYTNIFEKIIQDKGWLVPPFKRNAKKQKIYGDLSLNT